ncbi:MAG: cob(I)yrinic acid a,c-diamide adenosyltransferase [Planctomycetota bacterium]|nr:MAG: cob(I)yrinic acid a,c-diamide adenosyltransferase [Planctomycetota bacterium]
MVELNRIYTKVGDGGRTRLADGSEVAKSHPRVAAYGSVDEANAQLGLVALEPLPAGMGEELARVQNDCFDLGSDLATPSGGPWEERIPRISPGQVARLEGQIDAATAVLEPLRSFILPGGCRAAALLHVARTVVRRSEREAWLAHSLELAEGVPGLNPQALCYLNRLSDLCFVWARLANDQGRADVLWQPGAHR